MEYELGQKGQGHTACFNTACMDKLILQKNTEVLDALKTYLMMHNLFKLTFE